MWLDQQQFPSYLAGPLSLNAISHFFSGRNQSSHDFFTIQHSTDPTRLLELKIILWHGNGPRVRDESVTSMAIKAKDGSSV